MLALLLVPVVQAAEFDVGAGVEFTAYAEAGAADVGVGHAEVRALLDLGSLGLRADLDFGGAPTDMASRSELRSMTLVPEWGAVTLGVGQGWLVAAGWQPLPVGSEASDAWRNARVPYSPLGDAMIGAPMLGGRAWLAQGLWTPSLWGGIEAMGLEFGRPVVGAGVQVGEESGWRARAALTVRPVDQDGVLLVNGASPEDLPVRGQVDLWAEWEGSYGMVATVTALPDRVWQPVVGASVGSAGWTVDGGVQVAPLDSIRIKGTGRLDNGEVGVYASLSLVDEPSGADGWSPR